jgi:integrase
MTNPRKDIKNRPPLSNEEVQLMFRKADELQPEYFRLRARAFLSLLKTGKRLGEVARLRTTDLKVENNSLYVNFHLEKKLRKKAGEDKRVAVGVLTAIKRFDVHGANAKNILLLAEWLKVNARDSVWLFPSGESWFGNYHIDGSKHLQNRQFENVIKQLNARAWCHLFRETRGAAIVKKDEREKGEASLETVYRVKRSLNLQNTETAFRYIDRYGSERIAEEEETEAE